MPILLSFLLYFYAYDHSVIKPQARQLNSHFRIFRPLYNSRCLRSFLIVKSAMGHFLMLV